MSGRHRQRGFTLIELMVVVAIIGVLVALAVNLSAQTNGANSQTVSEQVVAQLQFARQRAVSTRRYHQVTITNNQVIISEGMTGASGTGSPKTGMATPASYREIQEMNLPSRVSFWDARSTVLPNPGTSITQSAVNYNLIIKPDGSCNGMTAFLTDQNTTRRERIIVYTITGSAYARQQW